AHRSGCGGSDRVRTGRTRAIRCDSGNFVYTLRASRDGNRRQRRMNILYVSQYFPPEMGAPAARVYELSREWARLGHEVTVLTGFPQHPTGVVPDESRGQLLRTETVRA